MCFVLIGCWPCGHMKPIRTRFCDQAESLHTEISLPVSPTSPQQPHGSSSATAAFSTARTSSLLSSHHHHHHHHPSTATRLVSGDVSSISTGSAKAASLAPCPKGVNQYDHAPTKTCPVCGREPKDGDDVSFLLRSGGQQQLQQPQLQRPLSSSSSPSSVAASMGGGCVGAVTGGGDGNAASSMSAAMMRTLTDDELAAQIFGDLEGVAGGMARVGTGAQQLLTPPTEVMGADSVGFGAFGGDASEAELFRWCVGGLPTSGYGL